MLQTPKEHMRRLIIIVGSPGSGKDELIRAVNVMGTYHAQIVRKHTSRERWKDDKEEIICPSDHDHDLQCCDIQYENYGDVYGIESAKIWKGLEKGIFQVVVVSNINAINRLRDIFGELVLLVYIHSNKNVHEYEVGETDLGKSPEYVKRRANDYPMAYAVFLENYMAFDHVLINSGTPEDLYDQIFRLFRAYERGDINYYGDKLP